MRVTGSFGDLARQRRKALDLTQEELADRVGCSPDSIRKIESGQRRPSRQMAELLAELLIAAPEDRASFIKFARLGTSTAASGHSDYGGTGVAPSASGYATRTAGSANGRYGLAMGNGKVAVQDVWDLRDLQMPISPPTPPNPYIGLRAFSETDSSYFYGREALVAQLYTRLAEASPKARFLAVVGPSGSGKSSLVRAGLIPALTKSGLPTPSGQVHLTTSTMVPGVHPMEELEAALLRVAANPPATLLAQLNEDKHGLSRAVKRILPQDANAELLLFIDQFEELFTLCEHRSERTFFLQSLSECVADPHSRLWIIVALRADFYDQPLLYQISADLMQARTETVGPMTPEELQQAVAGPAEQVGVAMEPGLLAAIIQEVGEQPGTLPLVQYTLTELFERSVRPDESGEQATYRPMRPVMSLSTYREIGGVSKALERKTDEIYAGFTPAEQSETRQLFLRLVTLGEGTEDTRRRVHRSELASAARDEDAFDRVLDVLGQQRLLTFDRDPVTRSPTVEVAHEALIRSWGKLREWLDASRADLRVQRQLASATAEWAQARRDPSFLARGTRLMQFDALTETAGANRVALNKEERDYLEVSIAQSERERAAARRRMRLVIAGTIAAFVVIGLFALAALLQANLASQQAELANQERSVALSREVAAESINQVQGDSMRSLLLGIEAAKISPTDESQNAIRQALLELAPPHVLYQGHEASGSMDFSPDSKRVAIAEHIGPVRIRDVESGDILADLDHKGLVDSIRFSPDGKWIAGGSRDRLVWIWDGQTGKTVYSMTGHAAPVFTIAFSPDSKLIVSGGADNTARVWDVTGGKQVALLQGHTGAVNAAAFSPDGKRVVTAGDDKTARVWDTATGKQLLELDGHSSAVNTAAFSPDGKSVLTAAQDNTARLWDAVTGKLLAVLAEDSDVVNNARFSPDGKSLLTASTGGSTRLWDLADVRKAAAAGQRPASKLVLQSGPAMDAQFSPDGKWIVATCSSPGAGHQWVARVFDSTSGKTVAELGGHEQVNDVPYGRPYPAARFSPDGKWLVVADGHAVGRVLQWEFYQPLSYLLGIVPKYATRQLTCEERQTYLHEQSACETPVAQPALMASPTR